MKRATQTVVPLPVSQCFEKRCAILERTSNGTPNYLRLCVVVREFGNQDGKAMIESAALVMHERNNRFLRLPKPGASMGALDP